MLLRALSSILFLGLIILTIPLTFDIGGRDAGLSLLTFHRRLLLLPLDPTNCDTRQLHVQKSPGQYIARSSMACHT